MARKKQTTTPTARQRTPSPTVPQREPWTPWGKWLKRRRDRIEQKRREKEERRRLKQEAARRRRLRRRRVTARGMTFLLLMAVACSVGFLVLAFMGRPYPWEALRDVTSVMGSTQTLDERQQRWESLAVRNYWVEVTYVEGNTQCGPAVLEVRNDAISTLPPAQAQQWSPLDECNAIAERLAIDGAFRWLAQEIQAFQPGNTYLHMEFDKDFGYPAFAESGVYEAVDFTPGCCWRAAW